MKKFYLVLALLLTLLALLAFYIAGHLPQTASFLLSKNFKFPIKLQELKFKPGGLKLSELEIFNLHPSAFDPALECQTIEIATTLKKIFSKQLTIDEILMQKIVLNIQFFDQAKKENNFSHLISEKPKKSKHQRPYLIKKLILQDIRVELIFADGSKQSVKIRELAFANITEKSGFPVDQIEKAILHEIIRSIFNQLGIKDLIRNLTPQFVPKAIPFF
ncbi:MAG: hypothetical protein WC371_00740 [Parachlamydiales bacterium]|jgi:hypothetical protein